MQTCECLNPNAACNLTTNVFLLDMADRDNANRKSLNLGAFVGTSVQASLANQVLFQARAYCLWFQPV